MFIAGISGITNIMILILLAFMNGIVVQPITQLILTYDFPNGLIGFDMVIVIEALIAVMCLVAGAISVWVFFQEAFSAVSYFPEV